MTGARALTTRSISRPSAVKYHSQGAGSAAANIDPSRTTTCNGRNAPPSTGLSGLMRSLKATRATDTAWEAPQFTGPLAMSSLPLRSMIISSPDTSTFRRTHFGVSSMPSLSMQPSACLLYTSDAADEEDSVDLG